MVMGLPDTKFGRMAPYLDLIIGMPIQVSQNVRAEKLVANGTLGHLEAIIYHPCTTFRLVHDSTADMTVKVPSMPPPAVLVRIERGASAMAMQGCNDANVFPLLFNAQAFNACDIALPGSIAGVPRSLSLRIQQFPLVCAVSSTVYNVQGETIGSMVVTEWRSKSAVANKKEQPYLLVSRVTTREAFCTLQPLTKDTISWAHSSQAALDEESRLEQLSIETIAKLKSQQHWNECQERPSGSKKI